MYSNYKPKGSSGYFGRACLEQDLSCVTAGCMAVRKEAYLSIGGMNEALAVAFNDVDFCIRLRAAGWRIIWTPTVELYHRESVSVGRHSSSKRAQQLSKEVDMMRRRWGPVLDLDPYYNVNLSLSEPFSLAFPPRQAVERDERVLKRQQSMVQPKRGIFGSTMDHAYGFDRSVQVACDPMILSAIAPTMIEPFACCA